METVRVAELVLDDDFYARAEVSEEHVCSIIDAMNAGVEFPPVLVDRKTKRVVDGFHRCRAAVFIHGAEARVGVEWSDYEDDRSFFLAALRANAGHGLKLQEHDRQVVIGKAAGFGLLPDEIASAMHMTVDRVRQIATAVSRIAASQTVVARSVRESEGAREPRYPDEPRSYEGPLPERIAKGARQLRDFIRNAGIDVQDSRCINELVGLRDDIDRALSTVPIRVRG